MKKTINLYFKNFSKDRIKMVLPRFNIGKIKIFQDGVRIKKYKGQYILIDDMNREHSLVLKTSFSDPYPYIFFDGEEHYVVEEHITFITKALAFVPFLANIFLLGINLITLTLPFLFTYFIISTFYKSKNENLSFFYALFFIIASIPACYYLAIFISKFLL